MGNQCTSMYPTRDGAVFCVVKEGQGHEGDHKGFRKTWRTCADCQGKGTTMKGLCTLRCTTCKRLGVVLVKKVKAA